MGFFQSLGKAIGSVASPLVSGAFGIGSALLGAKSQSDANKSNIKLAQMNNEWSERMMEKQNSYNIAQWQREAAFSKQQAADANAFTEYMQDKANKYNSASAQAARLREAGLNPAIVMSGQNAGTAQGASGAQASTPSGNSVGMPSPTTAQVRPISYDGFASAINNTVQMSMALSRQNAELSALDKRVDNETALAKARIAEMYEETRNSKFRNELNEITRDLQISNMNEDFLRKVQERTNMEQQEKLVKQQVIAQELINQNLPEQLAMNIAVQASIRDLNRENIKAVAEDIVRQSLENAQIRYSKSELDRLREATIDALESQKWTPLSNIGSSVIGTIGNIGKKPTRIYSPHQHYTSIYNK